MISIRTRKDLRKLADEDGYIRRPNQKRPVLRIYPDGSILRADVALDLAVNMTVTQAAKVLGS